MYICVSCIGDVRVGEKVFVSLDDTFDEISVKRITGETVGFVAGFGVEGCVSKTALQRCLKTTKIVADTAIRSADTVILHTDSSLLGCMLQSGKKREEKYVLSC